MKKFSVFYEEIVENPFKKKMKAVGVGVGFREFVGLGGPFETWTWWWIKDVKEPQIAYLAWIKSDDKPKAEDYIVIAKDEKSAKALAEKVLKEADWKGTVEKIEKDTKIKQVISEAVSKWESVSPTPEKPEVGVRLLSWKKGDKTVSITYRIPSAGVEDAFVVESDGKPRKFTNWDEELTIKLEGETNPRTVLRHAEKYVSFQKAKNYAEKLMETI